MATTDCFMKRLLRRSNIYHISSDFKSPENAIDDYAKDGAEELFTMMQYARITNLQRFYKNSVKNAVHLGKSSSPPYLA